MRPVPGCGVTAEEMNTNSEAGAAAKQTIRTSSGQELIAEILRGEHDAELSLSLPGQKHCVFHWGVCTETDRRWQVLPESALPAGTKAIANSAMQTVFAGGDRVRHIHIPLLGNVFPELIEFALFFPEENRWDSNQNRNYQIWLSNSGDPSAKPAEYLKTHTPAGEPVYERVFALKNDRQLVVQVVLSEHRYLVRLASNMPGPLLLHWGVSNHSTQEWLLPSETWRPANTSITSQNAVQTAFEMREGFRFLELTFPEPEAPGGMQFVLKGGANGEWIKNEHGNFYVPIRGVSLGVAGGCVGLAREIVERIIAAETSGSWTLMHRFNLCYDLLGQAQDDLDALALLFVWLRFSAIRQLTWQRNYNTKPRELAHAQDRLADRLADLYRQKPRARPLLRLMLTTIGKGGDGQRIRDGILQIMHRHHLKEVSGHFLEEWHQKLHNNTTPDDIVICQAYLEFLRSNGNLQRFFEVLEAGGVTKQRLESFERPIRTPPDFVGHLKDPLIRDFETFLKILNAVHSSTDLESALQSLSGGLDGELTKMLWQLWERRNDAGDAVVPLVEKITDARRRITGLLNSWQQIRPLLFLDVALEQLIRAVIERNLHNRLSPDQLAGLIGRILENISCSDDVREFSLGRAHWEHLWRLPLPNRSNPDWSLHARSVVDRIGRALADWTDALYAALQAKAELLGNAFHAEGWTVALFSEEVVRGSSFGFCLSMLLKQMDRLLRAAAGMGPWQIVSRGGGIGRVEVVERLGSIQARTFSEPVAIIADGVQGDEDLPEKVVAVLAPDVTDLVSHVAVRARNAQTLFASCSDPEVLSRLKALKGRFVQLELTPGGDIAYREVASAQGSELPTVRSAQPKQGARPRFSRYAVVADEFDDQIVGAKSLSQTRLRDCSPDWVRQPASVALPFGCCEQVLSLPLNAAVAKQYDRLVSATQGEVNVSNLAEIRALIKALACPAALETELLQACGKMGLLLPSDWPTVWDRIKEVWASKWNERAVLSRRRIGLPHEELFMAVLIQSVVEADYAFVIHTVNPSTNDPRELYAEVVLGLGETLVANAPGRAMGFVFNKANQQTHVSSYPSKSGGLFGGGLIFRSDSNGEDLEGYAGAGLYDSVVLPAPRHQWLDYSNEPLVWDTQFRAGVLNKIGRLGVAIETAVGSPQDIEGAICKGEYFVVQSRPQVGLEQKVSGEP